VSATPDPAPKKPNAATELAKERNRAAAERTLLAWVRTCLSLIGFGFGIDSIVSAIRSTAVGESVNPARLSLILGLAFVGLGTYAMFAATSEHRSELKHIEREEGYVYTSRRSLGLTVATSMIVIGSAAFVGILIRAIAQI